MSNLKTDIINYLKYQRIYGENIFFESCGFDFKIEKVIKPDVIINETPQNMKKQTIQEIDEIKELNTKTSLINKFIPNEKSVENNWKESKTLDVLNNSINNCLRCELGTTRKNFVFGKGDPKADLLIIGEAPGKDEDAKGEPFVGRSGKLLTTILESIQLAREDVFIANIIKCRPPNNRKPTTKEVETCEEYLHKQIELINPKYILALGLTAADTLLKEKCIMKDIRGEIMDYRGKKLMITYHPSALLRNPNLKRPVWEDMKKLKKLLLE